MKLEFIWPLPVARQWSIDQPTTIEHLPIAATKPMVRRIQMTYSAVTFSRKIWGQTTEIVLWQIDVILHLRDGSVFHSKQASAFPLKEALERAHYRAVDAYLATQRRQIQQKLTSMGL